MKVAPMLSQLGYSKTFLSAIRYCRGIFAEEELFNKGNGDNSLRSP